MWPEIICIPDPVHLQRKIAEGKFAKQFTEGCSSKTRELIEADVLLLRKCRSQAHFLYLLSQCCAVWEAEGEGKFAKFITRIYGPKTDSDWCRWYYCGSGKPGLDMDFVFFCTRKPSALTR